MVAAKVCRSAKMIGMRGRRLGVASVFLLSVVALSVPGIVGRANDAESPELASNGPQDDNRWVGDPIDAVTGNMYYEVTDVIIGSDFGWDLEFTRSYNSGSMADREVTEFGPKWTHTYSEHIVVDSVGWVTLIESTGRHVPFQAMVGPTDLHYILRYEMPGRTYSVIKPGNRVFHFRSDGRLQSIGDRDYERVRVSYEGGRLQRATDQSGRYLQFGYDSSGRMSTISLANDSVYARFDYDTAQRIILRRVTYADDTWEGYTYGTVHKQECLMKKRDNSDGVAWFYEYDFSPRATANYGNDSVHFVSLDYTISADFIKGTTTYKTVVSGEDTTVYEGQRIGSTGRRKLVSRTRLSGDRQTLTIQYDAAGNQVSARSWNALVDSIAYDSLGREAFRWTSGAGPAGPVFTTATFLPSQYTLADVLRAAAESAGDSTEFDFEYDDSGNITAINEYDVRRLTGKAATRATISYNEQGQILAVDGPELSDFDALTFEYYDNGDLKTQRTARGEVTTFGKRDQLGNRTWVREADGAEVTFHYDSRGRLAAVYLTTADGELETFHAEYSYAGDLTYLSQPDRSVISYAYDNHGWLVEVKHSEFGRAHYTYDRYGHVLDEVIITPQGDTLRATAMDGQ